MASNRTPLPDSRPQDDCGERSAFHLASSQFKRAVRYENKGKVPLESTPWGAELAEHEGEKRGVNRTFFPWEDA